MSSSIAWILATVFACSVPIQEAGATSLTCTVKTHHEVEDSGRLVQKSNSIYIGSRFAVATETGEIIGEPASNQTMPNRKVQVVSPGTHQMSATILTTRGGDFGRLADLLVIKTWAEDSHKPFTYLSGNFGVFAGSCVRN